MDKMKESTKKFLLKNVVDSRKEKEVTEEMNFTESTAGMNEPP